MISNIASFEIRIFKMSSVRSTRTKRKAFRMDLFDYMREQNREKESPLASRLRPTTLDEDGGAAAYYRKR